MRKAIRFIAVIILVLGILASVFTVYAINIPSATNDFYVNDFAGIFSEDEKSALLDKAINLANTKDGIQVVVTTVKTLDGNSIENYAVEMYNKYGIGRNDMGVLILLSIGDRQIRIEVGYAMEAYITDAKAGNLIDEYAISYLRDNKFNEGLISLQSAVISEITSKFESEAISKTNVLPSTSEEVSSPIAPEVKYSDSNQSSAWQVVLILLFVFIAILIIWFIISIILQNRKLKLEKEAQDLKIQNLSSEIQNLKYSLAKFEDKYTILMGKHSSLQKYCERAKRLHPSLDKEISAMIARENTTTPSLFAGRAFFPLSKLDLFDHTDDSKRDQQRIEKEERRKREREEAERSEEERRRREREEAKRREEERRRREQEEEDERRRRRQIFHNSSSFGSSSHFGGFGGHSGGGGASRGF